MSSVAIQGNASGAGVFTIASPNSASSYTLTLPTTTGTLIAGVATEAQGGIGTTVGYNGFKNRIINGAMMIDQRNAGASLSVTGAAFTVDRWRAQTPSGGAFQQITSTISGFAKSLKYTASASNSYMQMGQQIEYNNFYDCTGQTVIISFWAKANNSNAGSTALIARMRYGTTIDASVIFSSAATDTSITISTTATKYSFTYSVPSNAGAISVEYVLGSHVSGDGFEITGVQLEKGSTATSFDYRPYGTELQLCQRYYAMSYSQGVVAGTATRVGLVGAGLTGSTGGYAYASVNFPVTMRAAPTFSYWDGAGNASKTSYYTGVWNDNNAQLGSATLSTQSVGLLGNSGAQQILVQYTALAEL